MKKKIIIILIIAAGLILVLSLLPARIDCGDSTIFAIEDRKNAAGLVADKINSFDGCKLYAVKYEGDAVSQKNLDYCNSLAEKGTTYKDCIVFTSFFRSPILDGGAWNANEIYSWSWYLARTEDGPWDIIAYGYA